MPPRATSNTAVSTVGFWRTMSADFGPLMSPFFINRPSTTMPSVDVIPTRRPMSLRMCAIIRTVVVFPFVPVTARIGMRAVVPGGKSESMTGLATYCGSPSVGWVCIRNPGAALTSTIPPPVSRTGVAMSGQMKSMPATSSPTIWCRGLGDLHVVRVGLDRAVNGCPAGRHVARQRELDPRAFGRDVVEPEALGTDKLLGRRVDPDPREHLLVADAAPRVGIRDLDELANGVLRVGDDRGRDALGDRRDLAADDEAAVVVAGDVRLDHDVALAALSQGARIGRPNRFGRAQVEMDAASVVAVERLDHARVADAARGGHRRLLVLDHLGLRDRQAGRVQQPVREALVGRDIDGDGRCPRGHRRADPLLVDAVAELDERMAVEPDERDVAAHRLVDQRLRRWPERPPFGERDQLLELVGEVE